MNIFFRTPRHTLPRGNRTHIPLPPVEQLTACQLEYVQHWQDLEPGPRPIFKVNDQRHREASTIIEDWEKTAKKDAAIRADRERAAYSAECSDALQASLANSFKDKAVDLHCPFPLKSLGTSYPPAWTLVQPPRLDKPWKRGAWEALPHPNGSWLSLEQVQWEATRRNELLH